VNAKRQIVRLCTIGLLGFAALAAASPPAPGNSCGDFSAFLAEFQADKAYQLEHTKWPLHIANLSLCDENGRPRIHKESGQPYPKSWCAGDFEKSKFKNGVSMLRTVREKSHIREVVETSGNSATVLHLCDPANESTCFKYWTKYYFARDPRGCWRLDHEQQRIE
jgi:hypothetical protein